MPVLDAKALKTDPEGLAFLRDVLRPAGTEKPAAQQKQPARPRRKILNASPSAASFEPRQTPLTRILRRLRLHRSSCPEAPSPRIVCVSH